MVCNGGVDSVKERRLRQADRTCRPGRRRGSGAGLRSIGTLPCEGARCRRERCGADCVFGTHETTRFAEPASGNVTRTTGATWEFGQEHRSWQCPRNHGSSPSTRGVSGSAVIRRAGGPRRRRPTATVPVARAVPSAPGKWSDTTRPPASSGYLRSPANGGRNRH